MTKGKVSNDFASFYNGAHEKFEKARKGEEESQGIAMPIGTSGHAVIEDVVAAKSKNGKPYIRFDFSVVEPQEHAGKKFGKVHSLFDSDNMTMGERFQLCLDHAEEIGLTHETRMNHSDISEVAEELLGTPHYVEFVIVKGSGTGAYAKDSTTNAAPDFIPPQGKVESKAPTTPATSKTQGSGEEGEAVKYLNGVWDVLEHIGDGTIKIRSRTTGKEKIVNQAAVEEA